ncbi:methionyl-tRNA formyltransferase [Thalassotalea sp. 1_MG-2023]|uniref:methionyl-tRNA formyltransferase n=1 Tax=Thalassotalea sp. 1_MG-2023 TaxID=3062680 RepID=UPI0026E3F66A|nr:methionyl-tRNA formyltransferase [Thalassotalea sp. 1_MG-2023]MDO6427626.1 methionyl-tRNA formyltransferase [Thalassotalea sp. 1_MG-2023]
MSSPLNIIFAGTPDFAAKHLQALIDSPHNVVAVYCPPDKPAGRGKKLTACATKILAQENNLTVEQPINFKHQADQEILARYQADIMVVVAYGLLLPKVILSTPRLGCVNVHGSILPKWRGAAPIQRAVENGDPKTGVTIMQMNEGLDTGDILHIATCDISANDTSSSIYGKLAELGPKALINTLDNLANNTQQATPQDDNIATYAAKLDKTEAELNWQLSAKELDRKIRAYNPWPVAQFTFNEAADKQHRIRIWQADVVTCKAATPGTIIDADKNGILIATGEHGLLLKSIQLPGKKAMPVSDILNARSAWFTIGKSITGILEQHS